MITFLVAATLLASGQARQPTMTPPPASERGEPLVCPPAGCPQPVPVPYPSTGRAIVPGTTGPTNPPPPPVSTDHHISHGDEPGVLNPRPHKPVGNLPPRPS